MICSADERTSEPGSDRQSHRARTPAGRPDPDARPGRARRRRGVDLFRPDRQAAGPPGADRIPRRGGPARAGQVRAGHGVRSDPPAQPADHRPLPPRRARHARGDGRLRAHAAATISCCTSRSRTSPGCTRSSSRISAAARKSCSSAVRSCSTTAGSGRSKTSPQSSDPGQQHWNSTPTGRSGQTAHTKTYTSPTSPSIRSNRPDPLRSSGTTRSRTVSGATAPQ